MTLVKNSRALTFFVMSLVISASFAFAPLAAFAATITVDNTDLVPQTAKVDLPTVWNSDKWFFYNDSNETIMAIDEFASTSGSNTLTDGPDSTGAAKMKLHDAASRYNIATYKYRDMPLAGIDTLSYRMYDASASSQTPYLHFNVDFNNSDTWQRRLVQIPTGITSGTWTEVNALAGTWTLSGGNWPVGSTTAVAFAGSTPRPWADIITDYPNAETRSTDAFFGVRVGHPGPSGEEAYIDWINVDGEISDFEAVNNAPVANDQTVLIKKNTPWVIVLGASDIDGDSISLEDFTQPTHGGLEFIGSDLVYTPDEDYLGEDEFTFTVTDGELVSNEGTVSIVVYVDTPSCAEENMVFIGGGLDKCMNLDSIFARVFAVSPAVFPNLEIFVDAFEGFNLPQFLSFLDTIIPDFSSDIDGVFLDPVCVVGSIFNANFDVCVDDGSSGEEETPTDVCPNIDGDQSEVPSGKVIQDGQCVDQTTGGGGSTPAPTSGGGGSRGGGGGGGGPAIPQVLGAATGTCYQFTRNLSFGMRGDDVLELQKILTTKGYLTVPANSYFGVNTTAAVKAYQAANGLEQVGMTGPKTRALLNVCPGGVNPNQALIDELTKKLNVILAQIQQLLAARTQ